MEKVGFAEIKLLKNRDIQVKLKYGTMIFYCAVEEKT